MVNADALQLYRGLDIGTAKLTVPERRGVPHHLLDVLEPEAPFGESNGYVALEAYNMPVEVTAITHKTKPVFAPTSNGRRVLRMIVPPTPPSSKRASGDL